MTLQFLKFLLVGALNTMIGLAAITGSMYFFGVNPIVANFGGYILGVIVSFTLNGKLTFRQDSLSGEMFARFVGIYLLAYLVNLGAVEVSLSFNKYLAQLAGMFVYTAVGFAGCRLFVFRQPAQTHTG